MPIRLPTWRQLIPKPTFLLLHYTYICTMVMLGSVIIYGQRNLAYIDALFFASGAATQSGLNTVDVNSLKFYQQFVLYVVPLLTNPITIHTSIVFLRIYWFEKKFDSIVQDQKLGRWKSVTKSKNEETLVQTEPDTVERGVAGRPITILHHKPANIRGTKLTDAQSDGPAGSQPTSESSSSSASTRSSVSTEAEGRTVDIRTIGPPQTTNVDVGELSGLRPSPRRMPSPDDNEIQKVTSNNSQGLENGQQGHIAFVENRPPKKRTGVLRVPSPREFERGGTVEDIEEDDPSGLRRIHTTGQMSDDSESSPPRSRMRQRMGSISGRILARAHTAEAVTSGFSRGRSTSPHSRLTRRITRADPGLMPYLSYTPTVGRNSAFVDLTDEQKDELGGLEYRALKLLAKILVGYYLLFHIFGLICLTPYIMRSTKYGDVVNAAGIGRPWWAIFTSSAAFNDLGFTLTPDSMVSFQRATWPLAVMSFLIVIGNTAFPCMLRLIIWVMYKVIPAESHLSAPLGYLLDHPRRCFTLLFPSTATWWLFAILVFLSGADVILFIILDLKDPDVIGIPIGHRLMAGLFQAVSTRTAGFSVVGLAALHPAMQVSYMVMMYISIFPIAISVRRTNVYEESALGIYATEEDPEGKSASFVGAHLRNQLQYDLWYIFLGLFIIAIIEGKRIENTNEYAFTMFSILFEVVSAYGTVGLSLGYPDYNPSFSGQFRTLSKLVIIAMQIRGRHRGLPYQVDRAILLPSESLLRDQRLQRRPSFVSPGLPLNRTFSQATQRTNHTQMRPLTRDGDAYHQD